MTQPHPTFDKLAGPAGLVYESQQIIARRPVRLVTRECDGYVRRSGSTLRVMSRAAKRAEIFWKPIHASFRWAWRTFIMIAPSRFSPCPSLVLPQNMSLADV